MTEHDEPLKPLLAPDFVDVWLTLTFSLVTIKEAEGSLDSRDEVVVMPPTPSEPGWVVRMGYANDAHAELAARAAAVDYLLERVRPALGHANEFFTARDAMNRADEGRGPTTSRLAAEVRDAHDLLSQCYSRRDGFGY